jgi:hypothetical protein
MIAAGGLIQLFFAVTQFMKIIVHDRGIPRNQSVPADDDLLGAKQ